MKRFASIAAATAIAATCLVTPAASAAESALTCEQFTADFKAQGHEGKTAKEFADQYRKALITNMKKDSYTQLSDSEKKALAAQVDKLVKTGQACGTFKEEDRGSSATGSLSLSSALFGSS